MNNKVNKLMSFNHEILIKWMDQLEKYPFLLKYKKINHLYKQLNKMLIKAKKLKYQDYQDYFYNLYDLIYKKYFAIDLTDYFETIMQNTNLDDLSAIQAVWDLWFDVNSLQWWWYHLSNKIDYTDVDIAEQVVERTYNSLGYCLHDILTKYQDDSNFDPKYLPIMQEILNQYTDVNDYTGFVALAEKIDKIDPKLSLQEVIIQQDEEQLDRYAFCEMIKHFKRIIEFVNDWNKEI